MTDESIGFLVQCASTMRRGCDEQQEHAFWDEWLEGAEEKLPKKLFDKIIEEGLMFLRKDNKRIFQNKQLHIRNADIGDLSDLD